MLDSCVTPQIKWTIGVRCITWEYLLNLFACFEVHNFIISFSFLDIMRKARFISFDAMNTLVRLREPAYVTYEKFAYKNYLKVDHSRLKIALPVYYKEYWEKYPNFGFHGFPPAKNTEMFGSSKRWWLSFVKDVLADSCTAEERVQNREKLQDRCMETALELYEHFRTGHPVKVLDGARDVLKALTNRNYNLLVISNWDFRLREVLENCGLLEYFNSDGIFLAGEIGLAKPDAEIFRYVLGKIDLSASPHCLVHVGDDIKNDYFASQKANCRSILICHGQSQCGDYRKVPSRDKIDNLQELITFI